MVWTPARLYAASQWAKDVLSNIRKARSDCDESQLLRKGSEGCPQGPQGVGPSEASRLWTCGQPAVPVIHPGQGDLHGVLVLIMALSISTKRRMVATIATLCSLPLAIRCS